MDLASAFPPYPRRSDAKLAAELRNVLGGRTPRVSDVPRLRLTEQVVTEAMRLYPPAWGFGREALADCEIGGYSIPAGTTIIISPWVLHRDPRYFERPTEFLPERWKRRSWPGSFLGFGVHPVGRRAPHLHWQSLCHDGSGVDPGHGSGPLSTGPAKRPADRAAALNHVAPERWHSGPAGAPRSIVHPQLHLHHGESSGCPRRCCLNGGSSNERSRGLVVTVVWLATSNATQRRLLHSSASP